MEAEKEQRAMRGLDEEPEGDRVLAENRVEIVKETEDSCFYLVDNRTNGFNGLARGILDLPVKINLSWIENALVSAAHGDHHISHGR